MALKTISADWRLENAAGNGSTLSVASITTERELALPDQSGTLALLNLVFSVIAGVTLDNLTAGSIAIDTDTNQLVLRIGGRLLRFNADAEQQAASGTLFNSASNAYQIGLML